MTVRDFCAQEGLSEASFYSWRRELQRRTHDATTVANAAPVFLPVQVLTDDAPPSCPPIELVLASGHVLRIQSGFDAATLRALVALLSEGSSC